MPSAPFSAPSASSSSSPSSSPFPSYCGAGTVQHPYIVSFDGPEDKANPRNWKSSWKWTLMLIMTCQMTAGTGGVSIFTSGIQGMKKDFGCSREVVVVGTTLYLVALAISSLVTAPLGEMFGRKPVVQWSFFVYTFINLGLGFSNNIGCYLALRFIAGLFGSASMSHGPAMANDLFAEHEIALPLTLASVGRFLGPTIGPLIGGYINEYAGWRWIGWTMAIFSAIITLISFIVVPETFAPHILRKRAQRLAEKLDAHHVTVYEKDKVVGGWGVEAKKYLIRPFMFLFMEPIVFLLSLHVSFLYGVLNLYFSAYPYIFTTERGWSQGTSGLSFIAVVVGFVFCVPLAMYTSSLYAQACARSPTGKAPPEQRLYFGIIGAFLLPLSLFWLGWTANPKVYWLAPVASGVLFGMGQLGLSQSVFVYFSDAYQWQMGSVLAGSNFMRFAFGGIFPLFSTQMFHNLGPSWSLTLLGILCVFFLPAPVMFFFYGAKIRSWSKLAPPPSVDLEKNVRPGGSIDSTERRPGDRVEIDNGVP